MVRHRLYSGLAHLAAQVTRQRVHWQLVGLPAWVAAAMATFEYPGELGELAP
jgi:hypothetical protein